jgi:hypothetical protein
MVSGRAFFYVLRLLTGLRLLNLEGLVNVTKLEESVKRRQHFKNKRHLFQSKRQGYETPFLRTLNLHNFHCL